MSPTTTVIKIGGSTLGAEDTTLEDVAALQQAGERVVVVHGGGAMITDWLAKMAVPSEFVDGLRSTSAEALDVVIAVLRGVINAQLVAQLGALGARAIGLCGVDGGLVRAERYDARLGFVGQITGVNGELLRSLLDAGVVPVIAPIGLEPPEQPLNINADTVAGEVARAIAAERLVFLTDVDGLLDASGGVLSRLDAAQAEALRSGGTIAGGMIPKVEACFRATEGGGAAIMANGRTPGTLRRIVSGEQLGTRIEAPRIEA
jgi:acetylglutamate kinase